MTTHEDRDDGLVAVTERMHRHMERHDELSAEAAELTGRSATLREASERLRRESDLSRHHQQELLRGE